MWDTVPENMRTLVVLAGMAFLSLFVAGLIHKYERYIAEKRLIVQRLLRGVSQLEETFELVPAGSIPKGMGTWMRQEVLARYIAVKQVMSNHPGINQSISLAEQLVRQEPAGLSELAPPQLLEREPLDAYLKGLNSFATILHSNDFCGRMPKDQRREYLQSILLLEAESAYNYFIHQGSKLANAGRYGEAITEIRSLDSYLQRVNSPSSRLLELKRKTKEQFLAYCEQQISARVG